MENQIKKNKKIKITEQKPVQKIKIKIKMKEKWTPEKAQKKKKKKSWGVYNIHKCRGLD